MPYSLY
jgi:uncharacterized protein with von Willebrand factor type A (vWA) domain